MNTNLAIDILPPYLAKFWVSSYGSKWCQPIKLQDSLKCNISKKNGIKFYMQIKIEVDTIFYKLILPFWVIVTRHVQNYPKEVCISLQYLHKNMKYEVRFLAADKHKSFLQDDSITLGVCSQACPKYPILLQYLKENVRMRLIFDTCWSFLQSNTVILRVCGQSSYWPE